MMQRITHLIYTLLLLPLTALAQPQSVEQSLVDTAIELRQMAQQNDLAYQLLSSLTTEVGARHPGTPGEKAGIVWAQRELKRLGFDNVYLEPFSLKGWVRKTESASILSPSPQTMVVTALGYSSSTPVEGVTAKVRLFDSYEALDAVTDNSLAGQIVFINRRMQKTPDGADYGPVVVARSSGAVLAAQKGASALLIRSVGTSRQRFAHTGNMQYAPDRQKIPAAAISAPDADQLERLLALGQEVEINLNLQTQDLGDITSYNVIGEIIGRERPEEFVIMGGHLDSWDLGTGALDDGAGVALTMAAAHLVKQHLQQAPKRSLRVVLWGAEEVGLMGARAYAKRHLDSLSQFVVGSESDFGAGPIYGLQASVGKDAGFFMDAMAQVLGPLGIARYPGHTSGGPDMIPLAQLGVPALRLMQDGTDYFDYHHTPNDTLDKVDPEQLKQNLAAWVVYAYMAAEWTGSFR